MPRPPERRAPGLPHEGTDRAESRGGDGQSVGHARPEVDPELLDAVLLAALLGVSLRHVRGLHARGLLPGPVRLGSRVLWRRAEVRAWISAGCPARERWELMREAQEWRS